MIEIEFPVNCTKNEDKCEYVYAMKEAHRLAHNWFGGWYNPKKPNLPQSEYDSPTIISPSAKVAAAAVDMINELKKQFPYKKKLSKEQWESFVKLHAERSMALSKAVLSVRPPMKLTNDQKKIDDYIAAKNVMRQSSKFDLKLKELYGG